MRMFILNLLVALVWAMLWGRIAFLPLLVGFAIGFGLLWLLFRRDRYFRTFVSAVMLSGYFIRELVLSSIRVAVSAMSPDMGLKPAIVHMPLDAKSDIEIFLIANLITLTPGTLTLDVTPDRSHLIVHSIYAADTDALVAELKSGMERRVREVFRQ